jgi:hypothetical protein
VISFENDPSASRWSAPPRLRAGDARGNVEIRGEPVERRFVLRDPLGPRDFQELHDLLDHPDALDRPVANLDVTRARDRGQKRRLARAPAKREIERRGALDRSLLGRGERGDHRADRDAAHLLAHGKRACGLERMRDDRPPAAPAERLKRRVVETQLAAGHRHRGADVLHLDSRGDRRCRRAGQFGGEGRELREIEMRCYQIESTCRRPRAEREVQGAGDRRLAEIDREVEPGLRLRRIHTRDAPPRMDLGSGDLRIERFDCQGALTQANREARNDGWPARQEVDARVDRSRRVHAAVGADAQGAAHLQLGDDRLAILQHGRLIDRDRLRLDLFVEEREKRQPDGGRARFDDRDAGSRSCVRLADAEAVRRQRQAAPQRDLNPSERDLTSDEPAELRLGARPQRVRVDQERQGDRRRDERERQNTRASEGKLRRSSHSRSLIRGRSADPMRQDNAAPSACPKEAA